MVKAKAKIKKGKLKAKVKCPLVGEAELETWKAKFFGFVKNHWSQTSGMLARRQRCEAVFDAQNSAHDQCFV